MKWISGALLVLATTLGLGAVAAVPASAHTPSISAS